MLRRLGPVALALSLLVAAGCAQRTAPGRATATSGLTTALSHAAASEPALGFFAYTDLKALHRIGVVRSATGRFDLRWSYAGFGFGGLADYLVPLRDTLGADLTAGDSAVTIGNPPNVAVIVRGTFDAARVRGKLKGYGAKQRTFGATTGLSLAADNAIDLNSPLSRKFYIGNQLNQIVVDGDRFAASPNSSTIQDVLGPGSSPVIDEAGMRAMADCLGPVVVAAIYMPSLGRETVSRIGVGVTTPTKASGSQGEVLCVQPAVSGRYDALLHTVTQRFAPKATDPVTRLPLSRYLIDMHVGRAGNLIQATALNRPTAPVGHLLQGLYNGSTNYLAGIALPHVH